MDYKYHDLIQRLLETGEVFICGPDGSHKNKLRAYAYGGLLCRIPVKGANPSAKLDMPSTAYISSQYIEDINGAKKRLRSKDCPEDDSPFVWPEDNDARIELLKNHLDVILPAMKKWSEKNQKERGVQTAISLRYLDLRETGTVVCDFEHCMPAELYRAGYKEMLGAPPEDDKTPECDLILFSESPEGKPVFTLAELKCNSGACSEERSGLKAHSRDMLVACHVPDNKYKLELLRRLKTMVEHGLLKGVSEDLERWLADPKKVGLERMFVFTRGSGLKDAGDAAKLCEEYIPDQHKEFQYLFAEDAQGADLSRAESWDVFKGHK